MTLTNEEWLAENAKIVTIPISDDKTQEAYVSKIDGSYLAFVGMESNVDYLVTRGLTQVQNHHGNEDEDNRSSANIGFSEEEQKWYGWSHRAIFGFGVGDKVKKGDCAYEPTDKDDFLDDMVRFWSDPGNEQVKGEHIVWPDGDRGVETSWIRADDIPNEKLRGKPSSSFSRYPDVWGKGEWEAKTLDDARQMACDFAEGVS